MPDLKFSGTKIYFSIFNPPVLGHQPLVPIIDNPNFLDANSNIIDVIGIKQLLNGDIGITEKIMMPVLKPVVDTFLNNPVLKQSVAQANNLEINNSDAISAKIISNYIPKTTGMKAFEKTIITTMMESYKPLIELEKVLIELMGECEDVFCKYLGSYIKILGKEIGIKSLNPRYWDASLGYAKTAKYILPELTALNNAAIAEMDKSISNKNPIKHNLPNVSGAKDTGTTDKQSLYIGYFNNNGDSIIPPKWILESNKWFIKEAADKNGVIKKITAPFIQVDNNINIGTAQLKEYQNSIIDNLNNDKKDLIASIQTRLAEAQKITNPDLKNNEISSLNSEISIAEKSFDDTIQVMKDLFDGTNISDNNYVDIDDKSKGVNPPSSLTEWASKIKSGQLRQKYFPNQISTVQGLVDNKNNPIPPYIFIPKANVNYLGKNYQLEVPLAYSNQISTNKVYSSSVFYDGVQKDKLRKYSNQNSVSSLDIFANTDPNFPYKNINVTHFNNDISSLYIPDNIKKYYQPLEWEEILEYDVINNQTGQVISVDTEITPYSIDVENDYELRLIQVINTPILGTDNGGTIYDYFPHNNDLVLIQENGIQILSIASKLKGTSITMFKNLFRNKRYIDTNLFKVNTYFFLKLNGVWGNKINKDDEEVYKITGINNTTITNTYKGNVTINNSNKTITFVNSIPSYITDIQNNFTILSGINNGKTISISSVTNNTLIYSGDLLNDTLSSFKYSYIDSIEATISGTFVSNDTLLCDIYFINDIEYLPKNIKNDTLIIKGFDNNSLLSVVADKARRSKLSTNSLSNVDTSFDNYYKVEKITNVVNSKNVSIPLINIDFKLLPSKFYTSYSSDKTDNNYYPLNIVSLPNDFVGSKTNTIPTESGTLFSFNNNIPNKYDDSKEIDNSSTPDINEDNLLKEGIIFQGLDPRFINDKVFWLVEAIKKDNSGIASINGKYNKKELDNNKQTNSASGNDSRGKQWYGLVDKFTAIPLVATKIIPIIAKKLIPLLVKIIQLCSNPKKIQDLLLSIGMTDENISKFPQNFTDFSSNGDLGKSKDLKSSDIPKTFDDKPVGNNIYMGPQPDVKTPQPICALDGDASIEFGKGILSSPFVFGTKLNLGSFTTIKSASKKDSNKPATGENKAQPLFTMILNFAKMPFEIIFKVFKWIMDWVKKLINPANIASAMKELLSFEWMKEILGKDSILGILGINLSNNLDAYKNTITTDNQNIYNETLKALRNNDQKYLQVLVYDILINGIKVRQETVETPIDSPNNKPKSNTNIDDYDFVGKRDFSLKDAIGNNPFLGDAGSFNNLDLGLIGLKPLETIVGLMKFIQDFINGMLSMPTSILGLEPTISIPKFGKEIPFANILEDLLNQIKANVKPIVV